MKTLFKPNARPKTIYVKLTRNQHGKYVVERAKYLNIVNQYSSSAKNISKRTLTKELRRAVKNSKFLVA